MWIYNNVSMVIYNTDTGYRFKVKDRFVTMDQVGKRDWICVFSGKSENEAIKYMEKLSRELNAIIIEQ